MVEKMLFEDSLVCHDPPSARISPSNDSLPPPCRSTAGMRALSARFCLVEVRIHARISRTHVTPWNGWLCQIRQMCMVIDRPRLRSMCSAGAGEEVSPFSVSVFCTSFLWLRHFSLLAQVRCCCRRDDSLTLSFFFQAVTYRCAPAFGAFFYWFSVWRRRRRSAWSWRSTVASAGRSSFFLLPWNCLQFVLKAFSFSRQALLACCCNTPGIHNKLAGNESDRARTAVHRPRTRWSRFWFWERIFS